MQLVQNGAELHRTIGVVQPLYIGLHCTAPNAPTV